MLAPLLKVLLHSLAIALSVLIIIPAYGKTIVRMAHIETDPRTLEIWNDIRQQFEQQHPGVQVVFDYYENQDYKQQLPKLLASAQAPDLFYSWGGLGFREKVRSNQVRDISHRERELRRQLYRTGIKAFSHQGKLYGAPYLMSQVGFWYNRKLFYRAGISSADVRTWGGFLAAVQKLKAKGITPITLGAMDQWPVHFYWGYLAMRAGGPEPFSKILAEQGKGFKHPAFVRAGEELQRLANLNPFQPGFETMGYGEAASMFGNHQAAMHLMGDWDYSFQRQQSSSGKGVEDGDLGWFAFPVLEDGSGSELDSLGGINGFVASANASDEAIDWLVHFLSYKSQTRLASIDQILPAARRAGFYLNNPFKKFIFENVHLTTWSQTFLDQEFGALVGGSINESSLELVLGEITPEEAAATIHLAWKRSL